MLTSFGYVPAPFVGTVTLGRGTTNHGTGAEFNGKAGTALRLGWWELIADSDHALPVPAMTAVMSRVSGSRA